MKAVILHTRGGLDQLIYSNVATPKPGKNEALIRVVYCGLNHLDLLIRQGKRPGIPSFPHILGSEVVGEVDGEKVAVYPWTFCGECLQCLCGNEQICDKGGIIGRNRWGGYAQCLVAPVKNLVRLPQNISIEDACAITLAGTTAVHLLERAGIKDGSSVLVTGASGGVGTAVIQILKYKKCKVIAATSHPQKAKRLKDLNADIIVDTNNLVKEVLNYLPGGLDFAIDIVGGKVWSDSLDCLAKNGTLVFCSTSRQELGQVNIGQTFVKQLNILGVYGGNILHLKEAINLVQKGILKPVIDSIYPLEEALKAQEKMEAQHLFGKILLKI